MAFVSEQETLPFCPGRDSHPLPFIMLTCSCLLGSNLMNYHLAFADHVFGVLGQRNHPPLRPILLLLRPRSPPVWISHRRTRLRAEPYHTHCLPPPLVDDGTPKIGPSRGLRAWATEVVGACEEGHPFRRVTPTYPLKSGTPL